MIGYILLALLIGIFIFWRESRVGMAKPQFSYFDFWLLLIVYGGYEKVSAFLEARNVSGFAYVSAHIAAVIGVMVVALISSFYTYRNWRVEERVADDDDDAAGDAPCVCEQS